MLINCKPCPHIFTSLWASTSTSTLFCFIHLKIYKTKPNTVDHHKLPRSSVTHRGTKRRPMLEIRAKFHELRELEKFQTAKVTFKVIQEHWQWCHSIGHIQLCLYLTPLTRYSHLSHLFPKFKNSKRSCDSQRIPFRGNVSCMQ